MAVIIKKKNLAWGLRLKALRERSGKTQDQCRREMPCSKRTWERWESGVEPPEKNLDGIARVVGATREELQGEPFPRHYAPEQVEFCGEELATYESSTGPILVFVPLMEPDVQIEKMRQVLDYLTHCGIASSWAELARALNIQEWYLTDCAEGKRSLHPTIIEVIAHRWNVREDYWTAPQNESITSHLGKRSAPEEGGGDAQHLVALPHDPDARRAMDTFIQAAIDFAAKWPKKPEGGTGGEKK